MESSVIGLVLQQTFPISCHFYEGCTRQNQDESQANPLKCISGKSSKALLGIVHALVTRLREHIYKTIYDVGSYGVTEPVMPFVVGSYGIIDGIDGIGGITYQATCFFMRSCVILVHVKFCRGFRGILDPSLGSTNMSVTGSTNSSPCCSYALGISLATPSLESLHR